jgi:nucleoside-diphosphate-sugar epimerase
MRDCRVTVFHRGQTRSVGGTPEGVVELMGDRTDLERFIPSVRTAGPWDCIVDMIGGTAADALGLVEAARGRSAQVVACSTTSVYARPFAKVPPTEDAACAPTFPYGCNKLAFEQGLRAAAARGDFDLTIVRPAHTYHDSSPVVLSLGRRTSHLDRLLRGRPIVVHDDGQGQWSLAWADDVGEAFAAAVGNPRALGRTYHLAGAEWISWDNYHRALAVALGAPPPRILHIPAEKLARLLPARTEQCMRTLRFPGIYDCSAAARDLGYRPRVTVAHGFARNMAYLRDHGLIEDWSADPEYERLVNDVMQERGGARK